MTTTAPMKKQAATTEIPAEHRLNVGDGVTHTGYTDANAGHVVKVSKNGKTVMVQAAKQELLNGMKSGEADALTFTPGGFCGHTEGTQRWKVEPNPEGHLEKFTLRTIQGTEYDHEQRKRVPVTRYVWKKAGSRTREAGNTIRMGCRPHYDYNF